MFFSFTQYFLFIYLAQEQNPWRYFWRKATTSSGLMFPDIELTIQQHRCKYDKQSSFKSTFTVDFSAVDGRVFDAEVHNTENVINIKAITTGSIVINSRQLSIEFIAVKELHHVERVIS